MCSYHTERVEVAGSAKGPAGWFPLRLATVYYDHPQHTAADHTLNIDFLNPDLGPSTRVAVELSEQSARALVAAIHSALSAAPDAAGPALDRPTAATAACGCRSGRPTGPAGGKDALVRRGVVGVTGLEPAASSL